jgi:hypothetical protein
MAMMFWRPVIIRAILMAASTASDPEFQKKNESSDLSGMMGSSSWISWR